MHREGLKGYRKLQNTYYLFSLHAEVTYEDAETSANDVTNTAPTPEAVNPSQKKRNQSIDVMTRNNVTLSGENAGKVVTARNNIQQTGNATANTTAETQTSIFKVASAIGKKVSKNGLRSKKSFDIFKEVQKVLAGVPTEEKRLLGHQLSDFILDCEFGGYECYNNER